MGMNKSEVNYRQSTGEQRCGNCSMFRPLVFGYGSCTLVAGVIRDQDVCDRWEEKSAKKSLSF